MIYRHQFSVHAPLAKVARFHTLSSSMAAITPPPVIVRLHAAPEQLTDGSEMDFTLWMLFFPIHWLACIEQVAPNGFTDRQVRGPFARWEHRHNFQPIDEMRTQVEDEVNAQLSKHPGWWLISLGMWLSMPVLFAYRGWKTRRILKS